MGMKPTFFRSPADFRKWLARYHASKRELLVGFYRKASGRPSITWPESVDEALCFGWIDSIRRNINEISYSIRFTPRRPGSVWSSVNTRRAQALIEQGRMRPTGLQVFKARRANTSGIYSYEQRKLNLEEPYNQLLKKNKAAWRFFQTQPASYRKAVYWWIMSAKRDETRLKRLERFVAVSARQQRLPEYAARKRDR